MARKKKTKEYTNKWTIEGIPVEFEDIKKYQAFVYMITDLETGIKYCGKKNIYSHKKLKGATRKTTLESDWKYYYSSSVIIKNLVKIHGLDRFSREIIHLCDTVGQATFMEVYYQMIHGCLFIENKDLFYNDCVGKFRRRYSNSNKWLEEFLETKEISNATI
jgi:hypothetical protein